MNRRKFLAGVGAAALAFVAPEPSPAQIYINPTSLRPDVNTLGLPIQPTIVGQTLLNQQMSFYNPAGAASTINPFLTFGFPIAQGEFPGTGFKLGLYDATGTTKIADLQIDQKADRWLDGSYNFVVLTGYGTGTTIAGGGSGTWTIKAIAGTAPTTPVCSLAQLAANSNLKAVCTIGTATYTISANTVGATYPAPPGGSSAPRGFTQVWKSGPFANEWTFAQQLIADVGGAIHNWLWLKLIVTALSPTGPYIVRGLLENPNTYGATAGGTIGPAGTGAMSIVDKVELFNGSTLLGAIGGLNDPRTMTFAPANVNLANASVTPSGPIGSLGSINNVAFTFASTGTLPGGLTSTTTYWPAFDAVGGMIPFFSKYNCYKISNNVQTKKVIANGTAMAISNYVVANGAYYFVTKAGTSSGQQPTGSTFTDSNGVIYTAVSPQITSQGTGTHSVNLKVSTSQFTKAALMGPDTYAFWSGAGSLPKLRPGYPFTYLTQKTKAVPRFDASLTSKISSWVGGAVAYFPTHPLDIPTFIGTTGESLVDERVDAFSPSAAASIYKPSSTGFIDYIRAVALSFMDRQYYARDERGCTITTHNYGPNRDASVPYPNMSPVNQTFHLTITSSVSVGNPKSYNPWNGSPGDWYGYGQLSSADSGESSHNPNPCYWPYASSGDPIFLDPMLEYASFLQCSTGGSLGTHRNWTNAGLTYTFAFADNYAPRATAWCYKAWMQSEWIMPSSHAAYPLFRDIMDDTANHLIDYVRSTNSATAQSHGWVNMTYQTFGGPAQINEPWMVAYIFFMMGWSAWQGTRPGIGTFLSTYYNLFWLKLYDSDFGGTEKAIDAQYVELGSGTANPPLDSDWYATSQQMLAAPGVASYTTSYPPPSNNFVRGLQAQQAHAYVYWTVQPFSNTYLAASRAAMVMCSAAGMTQFTKVLSRVDALLSSSGLPIQFINPVSSGNGNGLMWAVA